MMLYAVIWKNKWGEAMGFVIENLEKAKQELEDVRSGHPEAVLIEFPIKGLIL